MAPRKPDLASYNAKRNFAETPEPKGAARAKRADGQRFVIQKHAARRTHFDLRLELDGVLLSWAVTRGPSSNPADKRLAVRTEDHPLAYADFEGKIPKGQYGGGSMMLWDQGLWEPYHDARQGLEQGKLHFRLDGERMHGGWALVRMRGKAGEKRENWLLIKDGDAYADDDGDRLLTEFTTSVATGRGMQQIADGAPAKPKRKGPARKAKAASASPAFRKPQLATLVSDAPDGEDWLNEVKFDGYRCLAAIGGGRVRCYTRSGKDWSDKFAPVTEALAALDCCSALLDGEVVAKPGGKGSQFSALQQALADGGDLAYFAFDLLELDGQDLTSEPLLTRKQHLHALLQTGRPDGILQYSEHVRGSGPRVLEAICKAGQEGIVAKRADAPYRGRRSRAWLKIKCTRRQEFVIGGWSPSESRGRPFASLLLGTYDNGELRYRGRVGSGFSADKLDAIAPRLNKLARASSPFPEVPAQIARDANWITPRLVCEVSFAEFTAEGHVRHGVFLGLRSDKAARDVIVERPKQMPTTDRSMMHDIRLTHPDRIVFPDQGVSKADLAAYYDAVSHRMLPHTAGHPLSLVRCPQGRSKKCFYQKHASAGFPDAIKPVEITESDGKPESYLYVTDAAGLVAAVQMGTLEFHIWGSRIDKLEKPDRLVFDLDPDTALTFRDVVAAAQDLRVALRDIGLQTVALVTGGKGVHVVAPLRRTADWATVKAFSKGFANSLAGQEPGRFTATMSKAKRKGRIFIDWLRNERGATAVAPYSTRARPGAPVAMPVSWDELPDLEAANTFGIAECLTRIEQKDPWAEAGGWSQSVTQKMLAEITSY